MGSLKIPSLALAVLGVAALAAPSAFADTLSAPATVSPANGATLTPAQFTTADWTDVTGSSTPITYRYESSNASSTKADGSFTSPIFQSGVLTSSQISTSGTPPGTYYWHARAVDNSGSTSPWSNTAMVTVTNATSTPTTTPPTLSAPTNLSPANGSTLTPSQFTKADWTDVTSSSTPVTYRYESSNASSTNPDGSFTSPIFQSGTLTNSEIPTSGTPPGTYYWHARAVDNSGVMSSWSMPWSVTVTNATSTPTTTPPTQTNYYPNAYPSQWYLLPGQQLSFSGSNFPPNDTLTISGGGNSYTAHSDGSGNFSASNVLTIPFSWQNTTQSFTVKAMSDGMSTPNPIVISIGTFYPQITPSSWWIGYNQGMSVSGTGFAPGEQVKLTVNGTQVGQNAADGSGNVNFSITTPGSGGSATLTATGLSSGQSSTRTIYLHG